MPRVTQMPLHLATHICPSHHSPMDLTQEATGNGKLPAVHTSQTLSMKVSSSGNTAEALMCLAMKPGRAVASDMPDARHSCCMVSTRMSCGRASMLAKPSSCMPLSLQMRCRVVSSALISPAPSQGVAQASLCRGITLLSGRVQSFHCPCEPLASGMLLHLYKYCL